MTTKHGKEDAIARRDAEAETTETRLRWFGRTPQRRWINGSVRTYLWWSATVAWAEVCVEQMRLYSTLRDWGTTRTFEASDLTHALRGLDAAELMLANVGRRHVRPPRLGERAVRDAVSRGNNPPRRVYVSGNVAALLWANEVLDGSDAICKVELIAVHERYGPERFIVAAQIGDAKKCFMDADAGILAIQEEIRKHKWT